MGYENKLMLPSGKPSLFPEEVAGPKKTSALGSSIGSILRISASTKMKIAVLGPIPKASDKMATSVVTGLLSIPRTPYRMSCNMVSIFSLSRFNSSSFVAQRHDWIYRHRSSRRDEAIDQCHRATRHHQDGKTDWIVRSDSVPP